MTEDHQVEHRCAYDGQADEPCWGGLRMVLWRWEGAPPDVVRFCEGHYPQVMLDDEGLDDEDALEEALRREAEAP